MTKRPKHGFVNLDIPDRVTVIKSEKRKRGFKTKKEAKEFERDSLATQQQSLEMKFSQFLVLYNEDMSTRLKPKTTLVKEYIIKKHILPYFENKKMNEIGAIDIRLWQNEILKMNFFSCLSKENQCTTHCHF